MKQRIIIFFVTFLAGIPGYGQIVGPQAPQFQNFNSATAPSFSAQPSTQQVHMGATAQDIANQQGYHQVSQTVAQKQQEITQLMNEIEAERQKNGVDPVQNYYRDSVANAEAIKGFYPALYHLKDMLNGKVHLSLADAYYTIESAYGSPYLTRSQYNETIKQSVDFIKTWMQENGLSLTDNNQVQYAIQKFIAEPLTISKNVPQKDKRQQLKAVTHEPFFYDYDDYEYIKDYRNCFLTKCLATGSGQCNSLPAVYLVLAEALGVKAYLSMAPNHSFIKHPDNTGYIHNYEPTSNWEISDQWYADNLFISQQAIASGVYLDTLNSRQIIANCAFDLALEYMRVDHSLNDDFVNDCEKAGIPYFPKNNNLESLFIYSVHLKTELRLIMEKYHITSIDDIGKIPQAAAVYREYLGNEAYITTLGYQDMPAGMYEEQMKQQEFKGRLQTGLHVNGKEKRNLFITTHQ